MPQIADKLSFRIWSDGQLLALLQGVAAVNVFVSLLRGINVGGHKKIRMVELRELYESAGYGSVSTYLQSGNVVFKTGEQHASSLAVSIEAAIERSFGYAVTVFIRDVHDFERIVHSNPFLKGRNEETANLYVTFLNSIPSDAALSNVNFRGGKADEFYVADKEIFLSCPNGYGNTKFSNTFFERQLHTTATTRNWNTVVALHKLANVG